MERKGFSLDGRFIFIDGRSGATLHSESFNEQILYNANQTTPALSSYFELMDRLIPSFLSTLSSQKIKGTRILLSSGGSSDPPSKRPETARFLATSAGDLLTCSVCVGRPDAACDHPVPERYRSCTRSSRPVAGRSK